MELVELNIEDLYKSESKKRFAFGKGGEKILYLFKKGDETLVIQEFIKPISESLLKATVIQQKILQLLMPERYVVDVKDFGMIDNRAVVVTNFVPIDDSRSPNPMDASSLIPYISCIKETPGFQNLIPVFRAIGMIPDNEPESGQAYTNELAGNTLFDRKGNQITVDLQSPVIDIEGKRRPVLIKEGVLKIASELDLSEQIVPLIMEYESLFTEKDLEVPKDN